MPSLFKRSGRNYVLQFRDSSRQPKSKQVALGTTQKRTAEKLKHTLTDLYARGLYDPWIDDFREVLERRRRPHKPRAAKSLGDAREAFMHSREGLAKAMKRMYELVTRSSPIMLGRRPF